MKNCTNRKRDGKEGSGRTAGLGGEIEFLLRQNISQKRIPYTKVGRLTRFPERRINEWIEVRTVEPALLKR
ncbi:MAG TPA: excisionase [Elusimicrobiota bacterium]|nr:excisionase [Elusimicrobiota bacterium]